MFVADWFTAAPISWAPGADGDQARLQWRGRGGKLVAPTERTPMNRPAGGAGDEGEEDRRRDRAHEAEQYGAA